MVVLNLVCMCILLASMSVHHEPEKGVRSPGTSCELQNGSGNQG